MCQASARSPEDVDGRSCIGDTSSANRRTLFSWTRQEYNLLRHVTDLATRAGRGRRASAHSTPSALMTTLLASQRRCIAAFLLGASSASAAAQHAETIPVI